jgi:hypothetical protein
MRERRRERDFAFFHETATSITIAADSNLA